MRGLERRWLLLLAICFLSFSSFGANLIPNSSFEAGAGRGWLMFNTANSPPYYGENYDISNSLTNGGSHGGVSMVVQGGVTLMSRAIWLAAGDYTLTFSARTLSGIQGPYFSGVLNPIDLDDPPPNTFSPTNAWGRFTNVFTASSNSFYWVKLYNLTQPTMLVDGIQLEAGTVASAYAPQSTVECGLSMTATNKMWFSGDVPTFDLNFWNDGASVVQRARYEVFDMWNSNVITSDLNIALGASAATISTIPMPTRTGWFRVVSRLTTVNDSYDEITCTVYPFAYNVTKELNSTNDWLGGHTLGSAFDVRRDAMSGMRWGRAGPVGRNSRWNVVEPSRGGFTFDDEVLTNAFARDLNVLAALSCFPDNTWPAWATNTAATTNSQFPHIGMWDGMAFSNLCFTVVNRYKLWVHTWEVWNEPYQSGPTGVLPSDSAQHIIDSDNGLDITGTNLPINVRVSTNYAKLLSYGVSGITNADPTARIIALSGAFGNPGTQPGAANGAEWGWNVWTNLTPNIQSWIYGVSTHVYAKYDDPNEIDNGSFTLMSGWLDTWRGVRPVWNTESGVYTHFGFTLKGLNGMFPGFGLASQGFYPGSFDVHIAYSADAEALRGEPMVRTKTQTMRNLTEALRSVGIGGAKFFYYNSVPISTAGFYQTTPYAPDYMHVSQPPVVALSVAQSMVRAPGFGRITNAIALEWRLEMYMHTNGNGNPVATAWSADRTNRTLTMSNSFFEVLDCMGNQIQTNTALVRVGPMPIYIRSGTLSLTQLSNTVAFSAGTNVADNLAPRLSFDVAPSGLWNGDTNLTLIKWTGIDDTWVAWATNNVSAPTATNVVFKWKLDGGTYTSYNQSNHVWLSNLSSGNHTILVTASDRNGNAQEYSYIFEPPPSALLVSGTARIGVVTLP